MTHITTPDLFGDLENVTLEGSTSTPYSRRIIDTNLVLEPTKQIVLDGLKHPLRLSYQSQFATVIPGPLLYSVCKRLDSPHYPSRCKQGSFSYICDLGKHKTFKGEFFQILGLGGDIQVSYFVKGLTDYIKSVNDERLVPTVIDFDYIHVNIGKSNVSPDIITARAPKHVKFAIKYRSREECLLSNNGWFTMLDDDPDSGNFEAVSIEARRSDASNTAVDRGLTIYRKDPL